MESQQKESPSEIKRRIAAKSARSNTKTRITSPFASKRELARRITSSTVNPMTRELLLNNTLERVEFKLHWPEFARFQSPRPTYKRLKTQRSAMSKLVDTVEQIGNDKVILNQQDHPEKFNKKSKDQRKAVSKLPIDTTPRN